MSVGTSDSTVTSPIKPEAHNLNTTIASAAQRSDGSPAPKNRQDQYFRPRWDCSNNVLESAMIVLILLSALAFAE